ncbi:MAG: hypothetical protein FIA95_12655 [Gemmatimonadetes bacterium]|nr:hypothetical protein [Gemmatimonadota bacterium]
MCTKIRRPTAGFALALCATLASHAPLAAQGVTYVTVTKPEMAGAMGMMARMAPGATAETTVTTFMQGSLVRTDEGEATSTITDLAAGRYTFLDHKEKTFYSVTMEQMMAQAQMFMGGRAAPPSQGAVQFKVERTGKTERFDGYTAEQVVMFTEPSPAPGAAAPPEGAGGTVFFTELWVSRDFPGWEAMKKAQDAMAAGAGGAMAGAFAADPAMVEAGRRMAEEMKGLEGIPVRTVTSFVMVPPGATLDKEAVLAGSDKPLQAEGGGLASAADAARQALGGLMGRGRRQQERPAPDAAPTQNVYMRVTQTVKDVKTGAIPDDRFQVPAGYREVTPGIR